MNPTTSPTPGPWRIGDAGRTVFGPPNGNPSPEIVATVHGGTSDQAAVVRAFRMKANARLIAAAPDLLGAVKAALAIAEVEDAVPVAVENLLRLAIH